MWSVPKACSGAGLLLRSSRHFHELLNSNLATLKAFGIDHILCSTGRGDRQNKQNQQEVFWIYIYLQVTKHS